MSRTFPCVAQLQQVGSTRAEIELAEQVRRVRGAQVVARPERRWFLSLLSLVQTPWLRPQRENLPRPGTTSWTSPTWQMVPIIWVVPGQSLALGKSPRSTVGRGSFSFRFPSFSFIPYWVD